MQCSGMRQLPCAYQEINIGNPTRIVTTRIDLLSRQVKSIKRRGTGEEGIACNRGILQYVNYILNTYIALH